METFYQQSAFDADQAELRALREGETSATVGAYDERLSGEAIDIGESESAASPFTTPRWGVEDNGVTQIVGETLRVIHERRRLLGVLYPFDIDRSGIRHRPSVDGVYEYLLATSDAVSNSERAYRRLVRHFERVAKSLVKVFLGPDSRAIRFGWPSEAYFENLSPAITQRLDTMKSACGFDEDDWQLSSSRYLTRKIENANDAKIDFVVRRSIVDNRPGSFTFLGQCGCGRSDVKEDSSKHRQLDDKWLEYFFDRTTVPRPMFIFATCQHVACPTQVYEKQSTGQSLLFDRIRLVKVASQYPDSLRDELKWMKLLTDFVKENPPKSSQVA